MWFSPQHLRIAGERSEQKKCTYKIHPHECDVKVTIIIVAMMVLILLMIMVVMILMKIKIEMTMMLLMMMMMKLHENLQVAIDTCQSLQKFEEEIHAQILRMFQNLKIA